MPHQPFDILQRLRGGPLFGAESEPAVIREPDE
jgi:hypothetical protein